MSKRREARIRWFAVGLVVAAALMVGFVEFFVMRTTAETLLRRSLESNLSMRAAEVARDIHDAVRSVQVVATRPFLAGQLVLVARGQKRARQALQRGLISFLPLGPSALALRAQRGPDLARVGRFVTHATLALPLKGIKGARLLWNRRRGFVLRQREPIWWAGHQVGTVTGEVPLPELTTIVRAAQTLGASADIALCAPRGTDMACFPTTLGPHKVFPHMARSLSGSPLPMSYALAGHSGFVVARNYRGHEVAAAYMPVASLGLGMVLSMNTVALYAPVWLPLWEILPLIVLVLVVAVLILRWQLAPLVAELVASEEDARQATDHWRQSEARVQAVLRHVDEGIATISEMGIIETFNPAMERLFGYTEKEVVGQNVTLLMAEPHRSQHDGYLQHYRETGEARVIGTGREVVARHRNGNEFAVDLRISEFFLGGQRRFIGTMRDATGRKAVESRMQYVATHDALTDLPNRTLIQVRMEQLIRRSERSGQLFAVMFVDLDHFKAINDSLGHDVGDQLLCLVAGRLRDILRVEDTVGRQGGDEFIVIAANLVAPMDAALIAEKILKALSAPYFIEGRSLYIGTSIGVALYPQDGRDVDSLLKYSDRAMYEAKGAGRGTYRYFGETMDAVASDQLALARDLHRALVLEELVLYYRPVVSLKDESVMAIEALLYWRHPQKGLIAADEFLPAAEEAGLAISLGEWTLRHIGQQFHAWTEQGFDVPRLFMNLSPRQMRDQRLTQSLQAILADMAMDPQGLGVEMTEDGVMDNPEEAIGILAQWRALGVEVALTEFGTGHSCLSYLKKLPLDTLKIDPSLVCDATTDPDEGAVLATVIAMAHEPKIQVVADGVEGEDQREFLRLHKCDAYQGVWAGESFAAKDCEPYLVAVAELRSEPP